MPSNSDSQIPIDNIELVYHFTPDNIPCENLGASGQRSHGRFKCNEFTGDYTLNRFINVTKKIRAFTRQTKCKKGVVEAQTFSATAVPVHYFPCSIRQKSLSCNFSKVTWKQHLINFADVFLLPPWLRVWQKHEVSDSREGQRLN